MGLPQINIAFKSKSVNAITRSATGIVALILRETKNPSEKIVTLKSIEDLKVADWSTDNADYIGKTLLGTPSKVVVLKLGVEGEDPEPVTAALTKLNLIVFNYLAMPEATPVEVDTIATWVKAKRDNDKRKIKAVLANKAADHLGIINPTTSKIYVGEKEYTAQQYTARFAGIFAGITADRSATYYVLEEVTRIEEHTTPDADIDNGQLILINDGEKIKIGRAVNSLTSITAEMKADWKKIKVVDVMDMISEDIRTVFNDEYVGKLQNITDNQVLFIVAIKAYFKSLAANGILDPNYDNTADIDVTAQRLAWESTGIDTTSWDDAKVRLMPYGSSVFLAGNVKIVDAVEDLDFNIFSA